MPNLTQPPIRFKSLEEANRYIKELHRDLERVTNRVPANKDDYQLGTFTDRRDLTTALTTAQLQAAVQTLIDDLKRLGLLNVKRT